VRYLFIGQAEAHTLFNLAGTAEQTLDGLSRLAPKATISLQQGEAGSTVLDGGRILRPRRRPVVQVVDPIGAGDAYAAGFLWAVLRGGDLELDPAARRVSRAGIEIQLTAKEFALLEILVRLKGRLLTRDHLIAEVWGADYFGDTKTLDVHVKRLRQKVEEDPHRPAHLLTVRGLGYRFVD